MHILKQSELDGMPCPDTLIHGECLEAMKHIADGSIDMICAEADVSEPRTLEDLADARRRFLSSVDFFPVEADLPAVLLSEG